jgi:hypothetical protein
MNKSSKIFLIIIGSILVLILGEYLLINPIIRNICEDGNYVQYSCKETEVFTYYPTHLVKKTLCNLQDREYTYFSSFFVKGRYRCNPHLLYTPMIRMEALPIDE